MTKPIGNFKHGMCYTPEWKTWAGIRTRTQNSKCNNYGIYGGRGIKVCERWLNSFEDFYADMGPRPSPKHSIERINNDGDYEPNNCRWATSKEQANNTRRNKFITYNGITKTFSQWEKELGTPRNLIERRFNAGWPLDKIFNRPVQEVRMKITFNGVTKESKEWSRDTGIPYKTLIGRLHAGWTIEHALTIPVSKKHTRAKLIGLQ